MVAFALNANFFMSLQVQKTENFWRSECFTALTESESMAMKVGLNLLEVKLGDIKVDRSLFLRKKYDMDAIQRYTERYESDPDSLPPIVLQKETQLLIDGFHRKQAMELAGLEKCFAEIIETDNPRLEAIRRNREHGVPLTKEERNNQIEVLHEEGLTQTDIGDLFNLSQNRVSEILKTLGISETDKINVSQILKERFIEGLTQKEVGESYGGITQSRVSQIEGEFKNKLAESFLSGESKEEILEWISQEHEFSLDIELLEETLASHNKVPACLVKEGNIELDGYRVEFRDAITALDEMEESSIDCIIADPPYGIGFSSPRYRNANFGEMANDDNPNVAIEALKRIGRVLKDNTHAYVFTRWDIYPLMVQHIPEELELSNLLVWDKGDGGHGMGNLKNYAPRYELIMLLEKGKRPIRGKRSPNVLTFQDIRHTKEPKYSSTQKPIALIKFLVEKSTDEEELVLDPFLGSGTTGVACLALKRQFLGFEIDKVYMEPIKRRFARQLKNV